MLDSTTDETVDIIDIQKAFENFKGKVSMAKNNRATFSLYKKYYKYAVVVTILIASIISVYIINNNITAKASKRISFLKYKP